MYKKILIILSFVFCFMLSFTLTSVKALELDGENDSILNEELQSETGADSDEDQNETENETIQVMLKAEPKE